MLHADVVIIGGGLVGASLAVALTSSSTIGGDSPRVLLVDPSPPQIGSEHVFPPVSIRTSTLNPTSVSFLRDLDVWDILPASRVAPVDALFVWDVPPGLDPTNFAAVDTQLSSSRTTVPHTPASAETLSAETNRAPPGVLHFRAKDIGYEVLAHVVDNAALRHALYLKLHRITQSPSSPLRVIPSALETIKFPSSSLTNSSPWPIIHLCDGTRVSARLIAACDGGKSKVRTLANADWFRHMYNQSAVVANVRVTDASFTAFQRFVSTGPVALLPLTSPPSKRSRVKNPDGAEKIDHRGPMANLVWSTTHAEARALLAVDDKVFCDELNTVLNSEEDDSGTYPHFASPFFGDDAKFTPRKRSNSFTSAFSAPFFSASKKFGLRRQDWPSVPTVTGIEGPRAKFPLSVGHASRYIIPERRTVLVGDAAHVVHPLAGQGVNLGFADAESLAHCVRAANSTGRDIGGEDGAPLRPYERDRIPPNVAAVLGLHTLSAVFSPTGSARTLRRVAMSAIDIMNPLKRAMLRIMR